MMDTKMMPSLIRACALTLATAFLAFGPMGCAEDSEQTVKAKDGKAAPCQKTCKTPCSPKKAKAPCSHKTAKKPNAPKRNVANAPVPKKTAQRAPDKKIDPVVKTDDRENMDDRKKRAEDMIYTTIRIRMEEMIEQRAQLLKDGKKPSDPEIRQLEGSIMRARDLLVENGEIVGKINPPIVQQRPNK